MEHWSPEEREEFRRRSTEQFAEYTRKLRDGIAGAFAFVPPVEAAARSHENLQLDDRTYGTLISATNAAELRAIRGDALVLLAEDNQKAAPDLTSILDRMINVLGAVLVSVDPPHEPAGADRTRRMPLHLLLTTFHVAAERASANADE